MSVASCEESVAQQCLSANGWDLERSLDHFFTNRHLYPEPKKRTKKVDPKKLEKLFSKYQAEDDDDMMYGEGMFAFLQAVGVDPEDATSLGVSWKLDCKTMAAITRKEFVEGFSAMGCDTEKKIKAEMKSMQSNFNNRMHFKPFYNWLFHYCTEGQRKTIDTDMAVNMWSLVLPPHWDLANSWCEFMSQTVPGKGDDEETFVYKAISKDLWSQTLAFALEVGSDLSQYEDDGAWPHQIDEFVEFMKNKGGDDDDDDE